MLDRVGPADVVTVTRIDRLARSTFDLFGIVKRIVDAKAQFRSLAEPWADAGTSTGRLMLAVLGGLADVERDLIRTRTAEGRSRAMAQGRQMGRPPALTPEQRKEAPQRRARGATLQELARPTPNFPPSMECGADRPAPGGPVRCKGRQTQPGCGGPPVTRAGRLSFAPRPRPGLFRLGIRVRLPGQARVELDENVPQDANARRQWVAIALDRAGQEGDEGELLVLREVGCRASGAG